MEPIVEFYRGTGTDHRGRSLEDVWSFSFAELESVHDFIQWLFPTVKRSAYNPWAPVLDDESIAGLRSIPDIADRLHRSLDLMLAFYGLERLEEDGTVAIREASTIEDRGPRWWGAANHNHLRLTRIIDSLRSLGQEDEALALERCLQALRRHHATGISESTARYWTAAARIAASAIDDGARNP
jgi:Opioid growth factor receptor (OGFr) conserved region